jgi:endogenous inhibitor of DNA gyrase (YacG/DUF329 family)
MSKAATTVGCPHCGRSGTVTLPTGSDEVPGLEDDRLKGRLVNCPDCGDEFAYYYY